MRHKVGFRKLGRVTPHRIALLRNMAVSLFEHEHVRTTLSKAKELRPYAEKLITQAKREDDRAHARRLVAREIRDVVVVTKLFDDLGARYATRPGGYTRILRLGPRRGDGAEMAIVELLGSEYKPEKPEEKGKKAETEKKPEAKAAKPAGKAKEPKAAKAKSKSEDGEKKKASAKSKGKKKAAGKEA